MYSPSGVGGKKEELRQIYKRSQKMVKMLHCCVQRAGES